MGTSMVYALEGRLKYVVVVTVKCPYFSTVGNLSGSEEDEDGDAEEETTIPRYVKYFENQSRLVQVHFTNQEISKKADFFNNLSRWRNVIREIG